MNNDAVQSSGQAGIFDFLSILGHRVCEIYIIGLPGEGREACIYIRIFDGVNASTFIVCSLQAEGVEDLVLIHIDMVQSAVTTSLTTRCGTGWQHELKMKSVVGKFPYRANIFTICI